MRIQAMDQTEATCCPAIVETGHEDYRAHEFVPTADDRLASPRDPVVRCDV